MSHYDHQHIESKWQAYWRKQKLFEVPDSIEGKENFYQLVEFPYPSGNLHVGHWYAFCVPDISARMKRMQGYNVLYPIGFDAFGLPAENAAIKHGLDPRDWTYKNMDHMRDQIGKMGPSFDTSREVVTCDPKYYKWTQWLFLQLYKAGLVDQKETQVNWCTDCKTVLANEQVISGECERCGNEVIKKEMKQWNIHITKYADRLIDDLDELDWPEEIKIAQKNWIGRSYGINITYQVDTKKKSGRDPQQVGGHTNEDTASPALPKTIVFDQLQKVKFVRKKGKLSEMQESIEKKDRHLVFDGATLLKHFNKKSKSEIRYRAKYASTVIAGLNKLHYVSDTEAVFAHGKKIFKVVLTPVDNRKQYVKTYYEWKKASQQYRQYQEQITIDVFTTTPVNFGMSFLVIAPEHKMINRITASEQKAEVQKYIAWCKTRTEIERTAEGKEKNRSLYGSICNQSSHERKSPDLGC